MGYLETFNFPEPQLCIFYVGGRIDGCNIEMHDVIFAVGQSDADIIPKIKQKWCGTEKSLHVDSWYAVKNVDGYDIKLVKDPNSTLEDNLYFVNLGAYRKNHFGENHFMELTVSISKQAAISKVKEQVEKEYEMVHADDAYDVDDCIKIDEVDGYTVELVYGGTKPQDFPINGWQRLKI